MKHRTLFAKVKGFNKAGNLVALASTENEDRHGEIVAKSAMAGAIPSFMKNPVILPGHEHTLEGGGVPTIGKVISADPDAKGGTEIEVEFAPKSVTPLGPQYRKAYELGFLNAFSIGFIPLKNERRKSGDDDESAGVFTHTEIDLLEISAVAVGSNRESLQLAAKSFDPVLKELAQEFLGILDTCAVKQDEDEDEDGPKCPEGQVWDAEAGECVPEEASDDEPAEEDGKAAQALVTLEAASKALELGLEGEDDDEAGADGGAPTPAPSGDEATPAPPADPAAAAPADEPSSDGAADDELPELDEAGTDGGADAAGDDDEPEVDLEDRENDDGGDPAGDESIHAGETLSINGQTYRLVKGAKLGAFLNRKIEAKADGDKAKRAAIIASMADASGVTPGVINGVIGGDPNCPHLPRFGAWARVLSTTVAEMRRAAEADGCKFTRPADLDASLLDPPMPSKSAVDESQVKRIELAAERIERAAEQAQAAADRAEAAAAELEARAPELDTTQAAKAATQAGAQAREAADQKRLDAIVGEFDKAHNAAVAGGSSQGNNGVAG